MPASARAETFDAAGYRPHIDGIRAIAIVAVLMYHAGVPGFGGGFVGVDVFFVISGYLITGLLLREWTETGDISIRRFIERRIRRLAPALTLTLAATLVGGFIWLSPIGGEQQGLAKSAIATVLLSANHYFALHSGSYFDGPAETLPLLHTWSLAVEEQFYLVWPWLILAVAGRFRNVSEGASTRVFVLLVGVFGLSLAASVLATRFSPTAAFFLMPFRAWEFAAGGGVYLLLLGRPEGAKQAPAAVVGAFGMLAILASVNQFNREMYFPGWLALLPVMGTAALIYGVEAQRKGYVAKVLSLRPLVWIGLISYSLYLWHWPVLSIARISTLGELSTFQTAALCGVSVVLAAATYYLVENPIRRLRAPIMAGQLRTYAAGSAMMAAVLALAVGLGVWAKVIWRLLPANVQKAESIASIRNPDWACKEGVPLPALGRRDLNCLIGDPDRVVNVVFWGDSHAGHLQPVVEGLASEGHAAHILRFMGGCPPLMGYQLPTPNASMKADCSLFNARVLEDLLQRAHRGLETVVMSARWVYYAVDDPTTRAMSDSLNATIAKLRAAGLTVVLVAPSVDFPHPVPSCLVRKPEVACDLSRDVVRQQQRRGVEFVRAAVDSSLQLVVVDPTAALCDSKRCKVRQSGEILYLDATHLTYAGSRLLMPAFRKAAGLVAVQADSAIPARAALRS